MAQILKGRTENLSINGAFQNIWLPLIIFTLTAVIFCLPLLRNFNFWGVEDWDEYLFRNALARETILEYHQFPLWNPYSCGGNVFLAHPTSSFLSPFFMLVLIFGEIYGLKLQVIIYLIIGMFGMFLLIKQLKLSKFSCYFSSFIYMLGAMYPLRAAAGLLGELSMALVPYLFLFYIKSAKNSKFIFGAIFFLALMIFSGSLRTINIFNFFLLIYSIFWACQQKSFKPLKILFLIFTGAFLLCAVKTIPMFDFLFHNPRILDNPKGISLKEALFVLLARVRTYDPDWIVSSYDWYHCGAYIGIIPLLLALLGMIYYFRVNWPLILTGLLFLLISMGKQFPINLWKIVHLLPIYNMLHAPPRFILGVVFCLAVMSGYGLFGIENFVKNKPVLFKLLIPAIVIFVIFDLSFVNSSILKGVFTITPKKVKKNSSFHQGLSKFDYVLDDSDIYPRFLMNEGTINAEEVDNIYPLERNVLPKSSTEYRGEAYLLKDKGRADIIYFSPNKLVLDINTPKNDILLLNQNYYKGWRVKKNDGIYNAVSFKGLISTAVSSGYNRIIFYYLPDSFIIGSVVSTMTFFLLLFLGIRIRKLENEIGISF